MGQTAFERLDLWRQHWRRSYGYLAPMRATRQLGLWPPPARPPVQWSGVRVLLARGDRFGDMMLTLPFVARILASGADLRVLATDGLSRQVLTRLGISCAATPDAVETGSEPGTDRPSIPDASRPAASAWRPDWIFFAEPARRLRSTRHPERWAFVEEVLRAFRGTPCAMPVMRRGEAMSVFPGSYCTPLSGVGSSRLLERFADGLGLERAARPLLHDWIADRETRRHGAVVLNLSAGRPGESDRRDLPVRFWSEVAEGLGDGVRVACIVQPGDERRRAEAEADARLAKGGEVVCFRDVCDAAAWLGRQRLLLSPETGLCHLARNLALPMVVLTPKLKIPYFYPRDPTTGFVVEKSLGDIAPSRVVEQARALLRDAAA